MFHGARVFGSGAFGGHGEKFGECFHGGLSDVREGFSGFDAEPEVFVFKLFSQGDDGLRGGGFEVR